MDFDDVAFARQLQEQFDQEAAGTLDSFPSGFSDFDLGPTNAHSSSDSNQKYDDPSLKEMSVVDPRWETIDPVPDIRALFITFNDKFFWGRLAGVEVRWSPRMTLCAGLCCYEGRGGLCSVRLSVPLLKLRPRKDLVETLLHEMIHAYLFITDNNKDHDGHGPEFCKHMNRLNKETGSSISIYHTFHDEVENYRTHWWKCNGPCQKMPPYFGMVKRSMNRAPSPRDTWWSRHQQTCGGEYTKVKEPENYKKKGAKKDEANGDKKEGMKKKEEKKPPPGMDIRKIFGGQGRAIGGSSSSGSKAIGGSTGLSSNTNTSNGHIRKPPSATVTSGSSFSKNDAWENARKNSPNKNTPNLPFSSTFPAATVSKTGPQNTKTGIWADLEDDEDFSQNGHGVQEGNHGKVPRPTGITRKFVNGNVVDLPDMQQDSIKDLAKSEDYNVSSISPVKKDYFPGGGNIIGGNSSKPTSLRDLYLKRYGATGSTVSKARSGPERIISESKESINVNRSFVTGISQEKKPGLNRVGSEPSLRKNLLSSSRAKSDSALKRSDVSPSQTSGKRGHRSSSDEMSETPSRKKRKSEDNWNMSIKDMFGKIKRERIASGENNRQSAMQNGSGKIKISGDTNRLVDDRGSPIHKRPSNEQGRSSNGQVESSGEHNRHSTMQNKSDNGKISGEKDRHVSDRGSPTHKRASNEQGRTSNGQIKSSGESSRLSSMQNKSDNFSDRGSPIHKRITNEQGRTSIGQVKSSNEHHRLTNDPGRSRVKHTNSASGGTKEKINSVRKKSVKNSKDPFAFKKPSPGRFISNADPRARRKKSDDEDENDFVPYSSTRNSVNTSSSSSKKAVNNGDFAVARTNSTGNLVSANNSSSSSNKRVNNGDYAVARTNSTGNLVSANNSSSSSNKRVDNGNNVSAPPNSASNVASSSSSSSSSSGAAAVETEERYPCPVCQAKIKSSLMNSHLDQCLLSG